MVADTFYWFYWDYSKAIPGIEELLDHDFRDEQAIERKEELFLNLAGHYVDMLEKVFLWPDKDNFLWASLFR